jgi:hypothetical protein
MYFSSLRRVSVLLVSCHAVYVVVKIKMQSRYNTGCDRRFSVDTNMAAGLVYVTDIVFIW